MNQSPAPLLLHLDSLPSPRFRCAYVPISVVVRSQTHSAIRLQFRRLVLVDRLAEGRAVSSGDASSNEPTHRSQRRRKVRCLVFVFRRESPSLTSQRFPIHSGPIRFTHATRPARAVVQRSSGDRRLDTRVCTPPSASRPHDDVMGCNTSAPKVRHDHTAAGVTHVHDDNRARVISADPCRHRVRVSSLSVCWSVG
jgi:hypothetical protein